MARKRGSSSKALVTAVSLIILAVHQAAPAERDAMYRENAFTGAFSGGDLNISSYVFRDANRNGTFDIGDRAMAHIAVEMACADGSRRVRRSNIAGFTNFTMSVLDRKADIANGGLCRFEAQPPSGWEVTTGNAEQDRRFQVLPGAPADLVSLDDSEPIGLAPVLNVSGRIISPDQQPVSVAAISPGGEERRLDIGEEGRFAFNADAGTWVLEVDDGQGAPIRRVVEVQDAPVLLSAIGEPGSAADGASNTTTATFDDIIGARAVAEVPSGIGGVGWSNWVVAHNLHYGGEGYVNGTMSGEYVAYNGSGHPAEIHSEEPFDFLGGYFAIAWSRAQGESLQVTGWRGDQMVYQDQIKLSALGPVYFSAEYHNVTRVQFSTKHYWQFVVDDVVLGVGQ